MFSKNRDRLLTSDVAQRFFAELNKQAKRFMADEHFTVDGTLIQVWASRKSFRRVDGFDDGDGGDFRGQSRSNKTYESRPTGIKILWRAKQCASCSSESKAIPSWLGQNSTKRKSLRSRILLSGSTS